MTPLRKLDPDALGAQLPRLYRAARALTGSRWAAEDLVQETCARVLARPRVLRGESEGAYLMRALRNTFIEGRRAEARRPPPGPLEDPEQGGPPVLAAGPDPQRAAEVGAIYDAIAALPIEFREALAAVDLLGLSYGEAARALDVAEGTITSRLYRARERVALTVAADPSEPARAPQ